MLTKKYKVMKKQFLVFDLFDTPNYYIVDDLNSLITEMYECELERETLETVTEWFNNNHKVFEVIGEIKELN
jgi:hypothetical protein